MQVSRSLRILHYADLLDAASFVPCCWPIRQAPVRQCCSVIISSLYYQQLVNLRSSVSPWSCLKVIYRPSYYLRIPPFRQFWPLTPLSVPSLVLWTLAAGCDYSAQSVLDYKASWGWWPIFLLRHKVRWRTFASLFWSSFAERFITRGLCTYWRPFCPYLHRHRLVFCRQSRALEPFLN